MRILLDAEPSYDRSHHYHENSPFSARWVTHPDAPAGNEFDGIFAARYCLTIDIEADTTARLHVSADERYEFFVDGLRVGRGPERGTIGHWHFESYDVPLRAGRNELIVIVHSLGRHRPYAQESVRHAVLVWAEGPLADRLSTGPAKWMAERIDAYRSVPASLPNSFIATGARYEINASKLHAPGPAVAVQDLSPVVLASMRMEAPGRWQLCPAQLPAMLEKPITVGDVRSCEGPVDAKAWQRFLAGTGELTIPSQSSSRVLIDLDDYVCAYSSLDVLGGNGARVEVRWAEALFDAEGRKQNRNAVDGMTFAGIGDAYLCNGSATTFAAPWWLAGRFVEVHVTTQAEALTLKRLTLTESRYPLQWDGAVDVDDPGIRSAFPLMKRALEACSGETFFDCPYFEQLMYVGDSRLEGLVTYLLSTDHRLPTKCVRVFDESRLSDGWTRSRCPSKMQQTIPPFSWWWVAMVHDQLMWCDRPEETASHLPGMRAVLDASLQRVNRDGLYEPGAGWNFVDWVDGWPGGVPRGGADRPTAPIHLQLAYVIGLAAEVEQAIGEPTLAERYRAAHERMIRAGSAAFFDKRRGLFADDTAHEFFSEHAQALAILSDAAGDNGGAVMERLLKSNDLAPASVYYSHYVFEALRLTDRVDAVIDRMNAWGGLVKQGFKTTPETFQNTRSDCHAWGAHPLFHVAATVLGIRPAGPFFKQVSVRPQLGKLQRAVALIVHPKGKIEVEAVRERSLLKVHTCLPDGVGGTLQIGSSSIDLTGEQNHTIRLS
ncbi:MAG: hypothetical protein QM770_15705 [Tepidisphaeraceae bacterium]